MGYEATTGVLICWNPDRHFYIHRSHHTRFGEYNYSLYMEYKHTTGYLLLKQDPESLLCHSGLINLIPCEIDLTSTPFHDTNIITY